jgi:hypothetical protein
MLKIFCGKKKSSMAFFTRSIPNRHILLAFFSSVALSSCGGGESAGSDVPRSREGDLSITASAFGDTISISSQARFAGAISSLTFRGKEYVDIFDHGRQMQSASSFDHLGECYNPTEAGSRDDGTGFSSSSVLLGISNGRNWLGTEAKMAYWLPPGADYWRTNGTVCGGRNDVTRSMNTTITSNHILKKRVEIGYAGLQNAISYQAEFVVPEYRIAGQFEAATVYTPKSFAKRLVLNPADGGLQETAVQGEQALPVILATNDHQHAIGIYSAKLPQNGVGYGTFSFPNTNKLNCVFRETNISPESYRYQCIFAVGTVREVVDTLLKLHESAAS